MEEETVKPDELKANEQPPTPELILCVRERDEAREQLKAKEQELVKVKSRSYELLKKIEELESQLKEAKKSTGKPHNKVPVANVNKQINKKDKNLTRVQKASKTPKKGTLHPIIIGREDVADDSIKFYQLISESMPRAPLSMVLKGERLFREGDVNGDGLIDVEELDKLLTNHFALYTRKQTEELLQSVDTDGSMTLDFMEVLEVLQNLEDGTAKSTLSEVSMKKDPKGSIACLLQ